MRNSYDAYETEIVDKIKYKVVVGSNIIKHVIEEEGYDNGIGIIGNGIAKSNPWIVNELNEMLKDITIVDDGENAKRLETALSIIEFLWKKGADRWTPLIVVAGGSLGDTAAFAASLYMRGIPLVHIPTTLLAMVDSSIGGKTAVNWKGYKNIIGSFYHPSLIIDDLRFVKTLPERVFRSSLAEVLKYGITLSRDFFNWLKENRSAIMKRNEDSLKYAILSSSKIKLSVVSKDPKERKGIREVLNYGHTVGHAIESLSNYKLYHGEAIALGMIVEAKYANLEGLLDTKSLEEIIKIVNDYKILRDAINDVELPNEEEYIEAILRDKKRKGDKIRLPIVREIGVWELAEIPVYDFARRTYKILRETYEELIGLQP